jgi:pimeloyl-ACP methyl ester carboxylesterase
MEALADDGAALLDALKLPSAVIGGVSMGGYVSLAFAKKYPTRTKALVLLDTQASADDEAGRARREASARDAEANGMAPIAEAMLPRLFGPEAPAQAKERIDAMMRANDPKGTAAASRGMGAREDTLSVLRTFPGHVLVVCGDKDVITPVEKAKAMAEACPGATLVVIEGAGHLAHLENPKRVNQALAELLAKVK